MDHLATDLDGVLSDAVRLPVHTADLRSLYRRLGGTLGQAPRKGGDLRHHARIIDPRPRAVSAEPAVVAGLIDGTQYRRLVTRLSHRPVTVEYVAAGCWRGGTSLDPFYQRLVVTCSHLDAEQVRDAAPDLPVIVLDDSFPESLEAAQADLVDRLRRHVEQLTWANATAGPDQLIIVDGDLTRAPAELHLVGVVKRAGIRYLPDLDQLPHRHLGPLLELPARCRGEHTRYCAHLRLVPAGPADPPEQGLIRLEAFDPGLLEPLAAYCLAHAQNRHSEDPRWDRQIATMGTAETVIKNTRPWVFRY